MSTGEKSLSTALQEKHLAAALRASYILHCGMKLFEHYTCEDLRFILGKDFLCCGGSFPKKLERSYSFIRSTVSCFSFEKVFHPHSLPNNKLSFQ